MIDKNKEEAIFDDHVDESLFDDEDRDLLCNCETSYDEDEYRAVCTERDEWKDKYLYAAAEIENLKKHQITALAESRWSSSASVLREMLDVVDDFERAILNNKKTFENDPMAEDVKLLSEGFSLIYKKLTSALDSLGCKRMELRPGNDKYVEFNTDFHEAVGTFPNNNPKLENMIVDVQQEGYIYRDRVLRHAKVIIGKSEN